MVARGSSRREETLLDVFKKISLYFLAYVFPQISSMSEPSVADKILACLVENKYQDAEGFTPSQKIAELVIGEKTPKKVINPILYDLEKQKKIEKKTNERGGEPRWRLCE